MTERMDGKRIQPIHLTPDRYAGSSIVENLVLASSNHLRGYLGIREVETLPAPIPKFVTRKNPSLDNYSAELLLRTCYEPVDYLPAYEEHVIRGSQEELPSSLNPRLVGAVLIGIGGMSNNPDFKKVYDEHSTHGTRRAKSVTQVVFEEHLKGYSDRASVKSLEPLLKEINEIDSEGRAPYDHIFNLAKSLNIAQFRQPGFVSESLEPQWKRAIIGAILCSVCVSMNAFEQYDNQKALQDLRMEFDLYLKKAAKMVENGYLESVSSVAVQWVREKILSPKISQLEGSPLYLTMRKMLFAMRKVWHPQVASFLIGFLFESMLQAQESFEQLKNKEVPIRSSVDPYAFLYYQKEPSDKLPQRGLIERMNNKRKRAVVVVNDPVRQITAVFSSKFMPKAIWKRFVDLLIEKEGDQTWYVPRQENDDYAKFVLNGTESFVGVPMTELSEDALFDLFQQACNRN